MKIALISCSKSKQNYLCEAKEMYSKSNLFNYSYEYAKINADKIYILSAKYGLLPDNQPIEPYDLTLNNMSNEQKYNWSNYVINQMKKEFDMENDEFIILAGKEYYINLLRYIKKFKLPLGNLTLGNRISFLQNYLNSLPIANNINIQNEHSMPHSVYKCKQLHIIFNNSINYDYSQIHNIPFNNGIYIMFEIGELYNDLNRIVRVGTHNVQGRLKIRLKDHFIRKNKDGSIFRKNVGKALLNKRNDDYLPIWNINTSKPENYSYVIRDKQNRIENEVTDYLQKNITFAALRVDDDNFRLRIEKAIIATLNSDNTFNPSQRWLGNYSPENKIKNSGMWLKDGLTHEILNDKEFEFIKTSMEDYSRESIANNYEVTINTKITNTAKSNIQLNKTNNPGVEEIKKYIADILETQRKNGNNECIIISGNIHKQMGLSNKMPSVCSAMYKLKKPNDEILRTTKSGKSSTISIKYYL